MPNWCSNRMYFSGEPAQIAEIKRLASGAVTPFYRRATNEGIQLFLAGSAGLLQTTEDVQFEPCPGLTAAGRGVVSPENIAFTRWLTHLQNGVLVNAGGEPFAVVQVQRRFAPEAVSHSLALAASLDTQGYSVNDIIHILMAEGGQV